MGSIIPYIKQPTRVLNTAHMSLRKLVQPTNQLRNTSQFVFSVNLNYHAVPQKNNQDLRWVDGLRAGQQAVIHWIEQQGGDRSLGRRL